MKSAGANPFNEHNKNLSLLQDVQNKKLLKGKRPLDYDSYEVCCSSLLWVEVSWLSSNVQAGSAGKAY